MEATSSSRNENGSLVCGIGLVSVSAQEVRIAILDEKKLRKYFFDLIASISIAAVSKMLTRDYV